MLDRPICSAEGPADSIRQPVTEPDRDVRPFQSVLLDRQSLIVGYDANRGEPRARWRKKEERTAGDCIDCQLCISTCPTGIVL